MAKTRQRKEQEVSALTDRLQRMKVTVFATNAGLNVKDMTKLRSLLREHNVDFIVAKKTLLKRALGAADLSNVDVSKIQRSFAAAFGFDDEVTSAKLLAQFAKTHETLTFVGGILNGSFISAEQVKDLAQLPTRDQLRGQLVGTIVGPLSGFINVMVGNLRGLVRVIDAVRTSRAPVPAS
ncbi:MAG: 50S ribosomal protein L10 [Candidatus Kerfeldbacteria bacterium]|nr:50S ribosomal protein L10 [Candidatus Kerfeldbacteria bacterium]